MTARLCVEYFTVGHPPVFRTDDPTVLAFGWGVIATWWVGLGLGVSLVLFARLGRPPKMTARRLLKPVGVLLAWVGMAAFVAGVKVLASAGGGPDKAAGLWETATGRELGHFRSDHPAGFASLSFSPNGKVLAAGGHDQTVQLFDLTTGKVLRVLRCQGTIPYRVLFSADGETFIAASYGKNIRAWSVATGTGRYHVETNGGFHFCIAVSADGRSLAGQDEEGQVHVWELATGQERAHFLQKEWVWALTFSPDGERLIGSLPAGRSACGTFPPGRKSAGGRDSRAWCGGSPIHLTATSWLRARITA